MSQLYSYIFKQKNYGYKVLGTCVSGEMYMREKKTTDDYDNQLEEFSALNNELASLHRELAKKNSELSRLNELKDNFIGILAHDLRNPLGTIRNLSEYLLDESKDWAKKVGAKTEETISTDKNLEDILDVVWIDGGMEFLESIKMASENMLNLVNELLDIQLIEGGNFHYSFEYTDLIKLMKQSLNGNQSIAQKKGIGLSFVCSLKSLEVYIDKTTVQQLLSTLLSNAIKFSFPDSIVQIVLRVEGEFLYIGSKTMVLAWSQKIWKNFSHLSRG